METPCLAQFEVFPTADTHDPTDQLITKSIMSSSRCVELRENFKLHKAGTTNDKDGTRYSQVQTFYHIPPPLDFWLEKEHI